MKKYLAFLLALLLVFSALPIQPVWAAPAPGADASESVQPPPAPTPKPEVKSDLLLLFVFSRCLKVDAWSFFSDWC